MKCRHIVLGSLAVALNVLSPVRAADFYAGRWDSTMYNMSDHPHTLALRVVVEDSETRLPLAGVELTIEGDYEEQSGFGQPEPREYELRAVTGKDGVAVFGLLWHDGSRTDDIEKVRNISARKSGYSYAEKHLNFGRLIRTSDDYERDGWRNLIRETPGAKYFVPVIGVKFTDWNNERCLKTDFFRLIRDEDYGEVFRAKDNTGHDFPSNFFTSNPQREAGPFMMLPVTFRMDRVFDEHRITIENERRRGWIEDGEGGTRRHVRPPEERQHSRPEIREREEPRDEKVWERYGDGYISEDQYYNVEKYINKSMTKAQILAVFGPPSNESVSYTKNTVMFWQSWKNSRHGIMVVINPEGRVTRIEKD